MAVGAFVGAATWLYEWGATALVRRVSTRVEFDSRDDSFRWVMEWLLENRQTEEEKEENNSERERGKNLNLILDTLKSIPESMSVL